MKNNIIKTISKFLAIILSIFFGFYLSQIEEVQSFILDILNKSGISKKVNLERSYLNIENIKDLYMLNVLDYSIDYIFIAADNNGKEYVAIYPFQVKTGMNLKNINVEKINGKNIITLPIPEITYYGEPLSKNPIIIVDEISDANPDYFKNSIIDGFKEYSIDIVLRKNIYEKTTNNVKQYISKLLYEQNYEIKETKLDTKFKRIEIDRLSSYFEVRKDYWIFKNYLNDGKYFSIVELNNSKIYLNFTQDYSNDENELFKQIKNIFKGDLTYKLYNPENLNEYKYFFKIYKKKNIAIGYIFTEGMLINFKMESKDIDSFKKDMPKLIYYLFSYKNNKKKDYVKIGDYKEFINILSSAQNILEKENNGEYKNVYNKIYSLKNDNYSKYGTYFINLDNLINENKDVSSDFSNEDLKILSKAYYYIKNNDEKILDIENKLLGWFEKNKNIEEKFDPYLDNRYKNDWFEKNEFKNLKDKIKIYLLLNYPNKLNEIDIENSIESIIKRGVYYKEAWELSFLTDSQRKEYLKKIYLNIIENNKIKNYFYFNQNGYLKSTEFYNNPNYNLSDILYDAMVKDKEGKVLISYDEIIDSIYNLIVKNKKIRSNLQKDLNLNFEEIYPLNDKNSVEDFIKNNLVLVLTKNKFNIPKNMFKNYDVFIFGKKGILNFVLSKELFGKEYKMKYEGLKFYDIKNISHKNEAFRVIVSKLSQKNSEANKNLRKELYIRISHVIIFLIRNYINIFRL
ncbi:hypothetical protein X275_08330 [Marinitoga sp. 1197]|uniref:DUF4230 domain-containing protein n=1 Tax=Marinitoga sp. 1197 TaxID=1428449 RepID=UPI0006417E51|nr:DUF4230 domain-containing protein [Marinitoga sp. 1197]KLO21730.1 hypothetical protein X275_08330 [Marinitoga sp. 1197]